MTIECPHCGVKNQVPTPTRGDSGCQCSSCKHMFDASLPHTPQGFWWIIIIAGGLAFLYFLEKGFPWFAAIMGGIVIGVSLLFWLPPIFLFFEQKHGKKVAQTRHEAEQPQVQVALEAKQREEQEHQRRTQAQFWYSLDGIQFEREIAKLFAQLEYSTQLTPTSGDEGIDILMWKDGKKIVVQCKAHRDPVGPSVIRELYGSMFHAEAQEAKLVACGGFTQGVYTFAKGKPIELLDLNAILHLQQQVKPLPPSAPNSTTDSSRTDQPLDDTPFYLSCDGEAQLAIGTMKKRLTASWTLIPMEESGDAMKMDGLTDLELDTALRQAGLSEQVIQSIMEKRKKTP